MPEPKVGPGKPTAAEGTSEPKTVSAKPTAPQAGEPGGKRTRRRRRRSSEASQIMAVARFFTGEKGASASALPVLKTEHPSEGRSDGNIGSEQPAVFPG